MDKCEYICVGVVIVVVLSAVLFAKWCWFLWFICFVASSNFFSIWLYFISTKKKKKLSEQNNQQQQQIGI